MRQGCWRKTTMIKTTTMRWQQRQQWCTASSQWRTRCPAKDTHEKYTQYTRQVADDKHNSQPKPCTWWYTQQVADDKHEAQPKKHARSRRNTHTPQQRNPAGDKSPKAVIAVKAPLIWRPIAECAQRLLIRENNTTERGPKARISIGGHSLGKKSLTRGQSMVEAWSRGGIRARMIKPKWSWSTT